MERKLYTARLQRSELLSDRAQCFHLEFVVEGAERFDFSAGQFVSLVAMDQRGKQQTRAYSIASAQAGNRFDLCLNRVEGGFFSNLLADMQPGDTVQFHGPHGLFTLRAPLTDSIFVATGTGIAPMRGFVQHLFPATGEDRTEGRHIWLVYGTRYSGDIYYRDFFHRVASQHSNFHYFTTLSRPDGSWTGPRGYVQEHVTRIAEKQLDNYAPHVASADGGLFTYNIHAYICGLNEMVSANREALKALGWDRKQIIFERYD